MSAVCFSHAVPVYGSSWRALGDGAYIYSDSHHLTNTIYLDEIRPVALYFDFNISFKLWRVVEFIWTNALFKRFKDSFWYQNSF